MSETITQHCLEEIGCSREEFENHPKTEDCPIDECYICAVRDCPEAEPLHYDKDGCPCCGAPTKEGACS